MSHAHRLVSLLVILAFSGALLVGCGKRGPLYMPDKKPVAPATTPANSPADALQP